MDRRYAVGIILIVALLGGWYLLHEDLSVDYSYTLGTVPYYTDGSGVHYPSQGCVFVNAYITETSTGDGTVLALPNCYSLETESGGRYDWKTGTTDRSQLRHGETAHIVTTYEVPSASERMRVVWNMSTVRAVPVSQTPF